MNIHSISAQHDYKLALHELSAGFDSQPEPGTEAGARFDILVTLVEVYEAKAFTIESPDHIQATVPEGGG